MRHRIDNMFPLIEGFFVASRPFGYGFVSLSLAPCCLSVPEYVLQGTKVGHLVAVRAILIVMLSIDLVDSICDPARILSMTVCLHRIFRAIQLLAGNLFIYFLSRK